MHEQPTRFIFQGELWHTLLESLKLTRRLYLHRISRGRRWLSWAGVHMQFDGKQGTEWGVEEPKDSVLVFIGRCILRTARYLITCCSDLDRASLEKRCLAY